MNWIYKDPISWSTGSTTSVGFTMFTCVMHRFTRFHDQDPLGSFNRIHHLDPPQDPRQDPPQGFNKICLKNPTWIATGFDQNTRSIRVPQQDVASGSTPGSTPGSTNRIHHLNLSLSSFQGNQESRKKHQEPLQRSTWIQQTDPPTGSTRIHNMNPLRSTNEIRLDPPTGQIWIHKNLFGVTLIHLFRPNTIGCTLSIIACLIRSLVLYWWIHNNCGSLVLP